MSESYPKGVTHKQFTKFLEAVAPEKPCVECGANVWATNSMVGSTEDDPELQMALIQGARTDRVLPLHTLYCQNCGTVKFYSALVVEKWVRENG